jgi:hypothetical protein
MKHFEEVKEVAEVAEVVEVVEVEPVKEDTELKKINNYEEIKWLTGC